MKNIFGKQYSTAPRLLLQITVAGFTVIYLTGCACKTWCKATSYLGAKKMDCDCICYYQAGSADSCYSASDLGFNGTPFPGEYLSNTISFGPSLSFKSSNEEYGGGYGKHEPGVGFNMGVGTVLPFNKHWAIAPSIRFTQKNASEKLSYSGGPGGGSMEFTDKYSYNYFGTTILAQYRAGKHLSFVAGPEINFLVAARLKNGGGSGTGEKQSITKTSNKVGLDMLAGIKFEIPAGNNRSRWGLQLLYDHRISRLNKKKDENGFDVPAYKMKSIQLALAYNIRGGGKTK